MNPEIRPARAEEMARFAEVGAIAFERQQAGSWEWLRPEWTLCAFEDGEMTTTHAAIPFQMRFNGAKLPVVGVTGVASLPWYRRRGHLRAIMADQFRRWHETGAAPIAILYASMAAIYQRFGYAVVSRRLAYQIDRRELAWSFPLVIPGRLRASGPAELPLLEDLYRRYTTRRTGPVHRSPEMWTHGAFQVHPGRGAVRTVLYEEAGDPLGYLIYSVADEPPAGPGPSQIIHLRELIWHSPAAYRALWDHLARIDLAKEVRAMPVPPDDPIFELLLEPRRLAPRHFDGLMARLIDITTALPARPYPAEARLTFELLDDLCPWNAGRWRLETSPSGAHLAAAAAAAPDLTLPVDTLAKLVFGYLTTSQAARMGRLEAHNPAALPNWDRALRTEFEPYCYDHF